MPNVIADPSLSQPRGPIGMGVGGLLLPDTQNGTPVRGSGLVTLHDTDRKSFFLSTPAGGVAPTAAMDIFQLTELNSASPRTRVRRLIIWNPGQQTAAGLVDLQFGVVSGATGSGAGQPGKWVNGDSEGSNHSVGQASGGGTFANGVPFIIPVFVPAAVAAFTPIVLDFPPGFLKGPATFTNTSCCVVLRHPGAAGASGFRATIEFVENFVSIPNQP